MIHWLTKRRDMVFGMLPFLHGTICRAIDRHREIRPELVVCGRMDQLLQAPLHTHDAKHTSHHTHQKLISKITHTYTHTLYKTHSVYNGTTICTLHTRRVSIGGAWEKYIGMGLHSLFSTRFYCSTRTE